MEILDSRGVDCSGPWLVWAREPEESFVKAMAAHGQLAPVLAAQEPGGTWTLVAGYKRLRALAELGREVAALRVEEEGGADAARRGLLYLADNQGRAAGSLTPAMQASALAYLRPLLTGRELADKAAPLLDLAPASRRWKRLLAWLALDDEAGDGFWLDALQSERLDLDCAETLAKLDASGLAAMRPFFSSWRWSRGAGREFLRNLHETALARGAEVADVAGDAALRGPLAQDLAPKDGMERLLRASRELRRPGLKRLEERFARLAAELGAGRQWRVEPARNFEADELQLTCRAREREALAQLAEELRAMAESPLWERLFDVTGQEDGK